MSCLPAIKTLIGLGVLIARLPVRPHPRRPVRFLGPAGTRKRHLGDSPRHRHRGRVLLLMLILTCWDSMARATKEQFSVHG